MSKKQTTQSELKNIIANMQQSDLLIFAGVCKLSVNTIKSFPSIHFLNKEQIFKYYPIFLKAKIELAQFCDDEQI